ncbi:hypothetical protein R5H30_19365 [Sulfitobacter sp. D35]|uniref:hypothetical protein n=1 Tax=Sulfitobacter sp. D35 TaxID=3083252 RepID=UPI00296EDB67|nr:hypothetical protein [Sulfitobacter sp. D35]MDW4500155.1 hypothetical protein [Sulfitobacter sp. D35]
MIAALSSRMMQGFSAPETRADVDRPCRRTAGPVFIGDAVLPVHGGTLLMALLRAEAERDRDGTMPDDRGTR